MEQSLFFVFDSILIFLIITIILNLAKKRRGKRGKEYEKDRIQTIKESYGTERKQFRSKEPSIDCSDNLTDEERKGFVGEKEIYDQIKQVQEIGAKVIWNCWLRYPNNGLTQVDIVLVIDQTMKIQKFSNLLPGFAKLFSREEFFIMPYVPDFTQWTEKMPRNQIDAATATK